MQIAITGIGIVSALGVGIDANRQQLLQGQSALRSPFILDTSHQEWPIGEVPLTNQQLCELLHIDSHSLLSRNILLGMVALKETIASAQLPTDSLASTSFINGTTVGGMDLVEHFYTEWKNRNWKHLSAMQQHEAHATTQYLQEYFGLAASTTISTACSSALNAIIHGAGLLRTGQVRQVIVGGTEAMTKFHLNGFASLGILSHMVCRPFQDDRDGINLGEGAAYLVMEDAQQALERHATIYGYLAGYANSCDAYHQTASSPEGEGAYSAMSEAIHMAQLTPKDIRYINAHGTATPNNDASELCAIQRLFGQDLPTIESTKPLTGHTTSASGSIEAVFSLIRMHSNHYAYALSNAFGFGGNDSSIVLAQSPVELPATVHADIQSTPLITSDGSMDYKPYIPPMQARRMTPLLRQLVVVAHKAIQEAKGVNIEGIVVGTRLGGMIPTTQLLDHLVSVGEQDLSPALFMNSTHNAPAGTLARLLNYKGYNSTIVSTLDPMAAAIEDAQLHLQTHSETGLLVCAIDEASDEWTQWMQQEHLTYHNTVQAQIIWN